MPVQVPQISSHAWYLERNDCTEKNKEMISVLSCWRQRGENPSAAANIYAETRQSVCSCNSEVARRSSVRGHPLRNCFLKRMEEVVTGIKFQSGPLEQNTCSRTKSSCTIHGCWRGQESMDETVYTSWRFVISWCFPSVNLKMYNSILSVLPLKRSKPKHAENMYNIIAPRLKLRIWNTI